jgi:hypothetical protein
MEKSFSVSLYQHISLIFYKIKHSFLSSPGQEQQKIFKAIYPIDHSKVEEKLAGFGWSSLNGIDPNPENFCGADIITTSIISYPLSLSFLFRCIVFSVHHFHHIFCFD